MDVKKLNKEELEKQINSIHENLVNQKLNCAERTILKVKSIFDFDRSILGKKEFR